MDHSGRLQFLFDKYLQRQCTKPELEELISLLQEADADELLTPAMQTLWQQVKEDKTVYPVDWDSMYSTISKSEEGLVELGRRKHHPLWSAKYKVAAVIITLGIGTAAYWYATGRFDHNNNRPQAAIPVQQQVYKNQTIHLPDGSRVILKADSKLHYPSAFTGTTREVSLEGEGYFDIQHNPKQPFLVHAGKITTRVLGTAFDIKAYPADNTVEITVTRGRVQVMRENKNLGLVNANQQISFNKKTETYALQKVDVKPIVAWKPQEIVFNDISMLEAAKKIEQQFNMVVEFVNPAIKECRVSATFSEDDTLNEMLTVICGVLKANYTIQNNKISIDGKACN
jgi:ferric-dicitrate binding protein FerR (iron transport regulator)